MKPAMKRPPGVVGKPPPTTQSMQRPGVRAIRVTTVARNCAMAIFKFNTSLQIEPKEWPVPQTLADSSVRIEHEDNRAVVECYNPSQEFGEGSEFGQAQRLISRRKKRGYHQAEYKADEQAWIMHVPQTQAARSVQINSVDKSAPRVRRLRGARDGTTCENADYWVLRSSAVDGTMEATIVDEWYNFIPIPTYKTMDIAEAEMLFEDRHKMLNLLALRAQLQKSTTEPPGTNNEPTIKRDKSFIIAETNKNESEDDADEDDDGNESGEQQKKTGNKKKTKKPRAKKPAATEDNEFARESSDGEEEGEEIDYMSDSESDAEPAVVAAKTEVDKEEQVDETEEPEEDIGADADGVADLFAGDDQSDSDEEAKISDDDEDKPGAATSQMDAKNKARHDQEWAKKMGDLDATKDSDDDDVSDIDEPDEDSAWKGLFNEPVTKSGKRPADQSSQAADIAGAVVPAKRARTDNAASELLQTTITESVVRRILLRRPFTTLELLKKLKQMCPPSTLQEDIVKRLADLLKTIKPHQKKKRIDEKVQLVMWLDPS